jgi:hypothetical protein
VVSTDDGIGIPFALVTLTSDFNTSSCSPHCASAITDDLGLFSFQGLEPETYSLAASYSGMDCAAVSLHVQAGHTTDALVRCTSRPPNETEIEGDWSFTRRLDSRTGSCPPALPEIGVGSMSNPGSKTVAIVGLDPDLTIVGAYDKGTGLYTGTGKAVLGDGSSIQTDVTAYFGWCCLGEPLGFYVSDPYVMTRRHRGSNGNLVCSEMYRAGGTAHSPWDY